MNKHKLFPPLPSSHLKRGSEVLPLEIFYNSVLLWDSVSTFSMNENKLSPPLKLGFERVVVHFPRTKTNFPLPSPLTKTGVKRGITLGICFRILHYSVRVLVHFRRRKQTFPSQMFSSQTNLTFPSSPLKRGPEYYPQKLV